MPRSNSAAAAAAGVNVSMLVMSVTVDAAVASMTLGQAGTMTTGGIMRTSALTGEGTEAEAAAEADLEKGEAEGSIKTLQQLRCTHKMHTTQCVTRPFLGGMLPRAFVLRFLMHMVAQCAAGSDKQCVTAALCACQHISAASGW